MRGVKVFKAREVREICEFDGAGGAVALLGDDDFGLAFDVFVLAVVILFAMDEGYDVGVLFDGA